MSIGVKMAAMPRSIACILTMICSVVLTAPSFAQLPELGRGKVPTLAPLVRQVTPSVVNISVRGRVKEDNPLFRDPVYRELFELPKHVERELQAVGSGAVVDAERGYVLTANHVVAQASTVQVTMKDGRRFVAKLVGRDPGTDLAVLRLQAAEALTAIPMGDSDRLEVGDFVIAVGNPFGLGQTVTSGLVSALGRTGLGKQGYEDFIQTDAAINPGNSGGALVNMQGELVGINTAIFSAGGGNVGIGFAVPVNMARRVMEQIVEHGHVRRGGIGVSIKDLSPAIGAARVCADRGRRYDRGRQRWLPGGAGRNPKRRCRCCCRRSADPQRRSSSRRAGPHPCGRARATNCETGRCGPQCIGRSGSCQRDNLASQQGRQPSTILSPGVVNSGRALWRRHRRRGECFFRGIDLRLHGVELGA